MYNLDKMKGFDSKGERKCLEAVELVNIALKDDRFKAIFMKKKLTETLPRIGGWKTPFNNEEVINLLERARIEFSLNYYYRWWSKVVGWTTLGGKVINVNGKYFDRTTKTGAASNILHEGAHIVGFTHNKGFSTSVPYSLNRAFEEWTSRF